MGSSLGKQRPRATLSPAHIGDLDFAMVLVWMELDSDGGISDRGYFEEASDLPQDS